MNNYLGIAIYVVIIVAAIATIIFIIGVFALFLIGWFHRRRRKVGEADQLKWLEELEKELEVGKCDNGDVLEFLIRSIELEHKPSAALTKRLENVRRILAS
jgi:hypothetical protein